MSPVLAICEYPQPRGEGGGRGWGGKWAVSHSRKSKICQNALDRNQENLTHQVDGLGPRGPRPSNRRDVSLFTWTVSGCIDCMVLEWPEHGMFLSLWTAADRVGLVSEEGCWA